MKAQDYQEDPEFRSWLERIIDAKVREELSRERDRRYREGFAVISVRDDCVLAKRIANQLGKSLVRAQLLEFGDGEKKTVIEENLRGKDVYVIAAVGEDEDPDVSLANTCKFVATLNRTCKVSTINVVAPCLWYQAQDKTHARREPITVRDVADDLARRGMEHIFVVELHAEQIEIAFDSFDHLKMTPLFGDYICRRFSGLDEQLVLIAPDDGGVRTREDLHKNVDPKLLAGQAAVHQLRKRRGVDEKQLMDFVGDVEGKIGIVFDDMMRSGTTMFQAASAAKKAGARMVIGVAAHFYGYDSLTHGTFENRLLESDLDELVVSNTRPDIEHRLARNPVLRAKLTVLDIAHYLAQAIRNYETGGTIKDMLTRLLDRRELYDLLHEAENSRQIP